MAIFPKEKIKIIEIANKYKQPIHNSINENKHFERFVKDDLCDAIADKLNDLGYIKYKTLIKGNNVTVTAKLTIIC